MISCKKAVDYISKKEEKKLSAGQRFALWRHLKACSLCHTFNAQNKIIRKAIGQQPDKTLTPAEKEAIINTAIVKEQ